MKARPLGLTAVAAAELIDATCRVDESLLPCIKWMARRTDFDVEIFAERRARLKGVATAAVDRQGGVIRVSFRLHEGFSCKTCGPK